MWDNYFAKTSGRDCEYLKNSDSLKDYHLFFPKTLAEDSTPENSNQRWPIDMDVSNAHIYLDYLKIRQTILKNKLCLLIFTRHLNSYNWIKKLKGFE